MFGKGKVPQSLVDAVSSITESKWEKEKTSTGTKVYGSSYGNSAKAKRDQTKKDIDTIKGPKEKEMKEESTLSFKERLILSFREEKEVEQQIQEVLKKDASAGDWIHDFVHSDNPKFKGKTKAQRKKMALGAYYAKQNEETDLEEGYENSKDDKKDDAEEAKKLGISVAEYEKTEKDKKEDKEEKKEKGKEEKGEKEDVKEELKGKQYKLDKNKNGKLDSDDFKKLRNEEESVDEAMQKADVPAYLRKQKGEKPLTVADVKAPRPDSISSKEGLAKLRGEEVELDENNQAEVDSSPVTTDTLAGRVPGGKSNSFKSFKLRVKPLDKEGEESNKAPECDEPEKTPARASIKAEEVEQVQERDEGKPGLMFKKIALKAGKKYGSKEAGERVAGAIRKKVLAKEELVDEAKDPNMDAGVGAQPDFATEGSWKKETPWMKSKGTVTDKSGAKHTPMSRAKDLARSSLEKVKKDVLGK